jgi:hypothetical protein
MTEQPMPTRNGHVSIQSLVRSELHGPAFALVRADLEARELVGIERYGTPLQPFNGRDAVRDAYEEALDLACYLKQAIVEGHVELEQLYSDAVIACAALRHALGESRVITENDLWEDPDVVRAKAFAYAQTGRLDYTIRERVSDGRWQFLPGGITPKPGEVPSAAPTP